MRKKLIMLAVLAIVTLSLSSSVYAGAWSEYAATRIYDTIYYGARGVKGDFKLPSIDSQWSSTHDYNFITFEEWIGVNGTKLSWPTYDWEWFEIGYMDGAIDPENDGTIEDYKGFFKAKNINGEYWEAKLNKTATVGTTYTYTIVDVNITDTWDIYIGSTHFGSFADSVPISYDLIVKQGYETNIEPGTENATLSSTEITNQYYRSGGTWKTWSSISSSVEEQDTTSLANVSYSSSNNKTTITKQ